MIRCLKLGSLLLLFLLDYHMAVAQTAPISRDEIRKTELQLRQFSDSAMKGSSDLVRQAAMAIFSPVLLDLLNHPATFDYPFDSIPALSKVTSHDKRVRIYTWILPSRALGTYKYFGIIQRKHPVSGQLKVIGLMELNLGKEEAEKNELKPDTWYGAAYYEIIEKKINKKVHYFLLGWKGFDRLITKKVIDVIYFDAWDNVTFGAPVLTDGTKKKKHRIIFEYNAQAVMLLRYEKKKNRIIFDHLSPSSPSLKGQFHHYGPDFTYDGLHFRKGMWNYKSNLDLRNSGDRK